MPRVHTHYDNLKVSKDAPIEVIRAAYKSLAAKYHPDHHSGSENSAKIMRIINASYEVLSDPDKRRAHDEWIAGKEIKPVQEEPPPLPKEQRSSSWPEPDRTRRRRTIMEPDWEPPPPAPNKSNAALGAGIIGALILAVIAVDIFVGPTSSSAVPSTPVPPISAASNSSAPITSSDETNPKSVTPAVASRTNIPARTQQMEFAPEELKPLPPKPAPPRYVRPALAPNGQPWPVESGYLKGFDQRNGGGRSNLTVDNRNSPSDVVVGVYDHTHDVPARVFFLRAHDQFTAYGFTPGEYDVRYGDLDSGDTFRSDPIEFQEVQDQRGAHWHDSTVTLYKKTNPKHPIHFESIGSEEFIKFQTN